MLGQAAYLRVWLLPTPTTIEPARNPVSIDDVTIKSADTSARLTFSRLSGDYFLSAYESPDVVVRRMVWGYSDSELLVDRFDFMADNWRGWKTDLLWSSIEGEFFFDAKSDGLGHVTLILSFSQSDGPEFWQVRVRLNIEAGQLASIAREIRRFFASSPIALPTP